MLTQITGDEQTKGIEENSVRSHKLGKGTKRFSTEEGARKLLKCLTSRGPLDNDSMETSNNSKLASTNNDSKKTTEELNDDSMKRGK